MSGRVKWERPRYARTLRALVVDGRDVGVINQPRSGGPCEAWMLYEDADRVTRRRSDAKRWLLARAAGLAEVPRARRRHSRSGWQCIDRVGPISVWERNRRRR